MIPNDLRPVRSARGSRAFDVRYGVLALALLLVVAAEMYVQPWTTGSDFWGHAAAVRELMRHPGHPGHPYIATDDPNIFLTPWTLGLACVARWVGASPVDALRVAGIFNLVCLLLALHWWVSELCDRRDTPFWTLLFTLFLWGPVQGWQYSGFVHWAALPSLAYPSAFALAAGLAGMAAFRRYLVAGSGGWALIAVITGPVTLLTHPIAAIFLFVGMAAMVVGASRDQMPRGFVIAGTSVLVAVLAGVGWPYYPFWELVRSGANYIHWANRTMYTTVVWRTLPAWVAGLVLLGRFRADRRDPLVWMSALLVMVYVYGGLSGSYSYGRVMSPLMLVLHLALAEWLAANEDRLRQFFTTSWRFRFAGLAAASLAVVICYDHLQAGVVRSTLLPRVLSSAGTTAYPRPLSERYQFLSDWVGDDDVVWTDLRTGWPVPAFAGKVVGPSHPQAFVDDIEQRWDVCRRFTWAKPTDEERRRVIDHYHVRWLLLDRRQKETDARTVTMMSTFGRLVTSSHGLLLFEVR